LEKIFVSASSALIGSRRGGKQTCGNIIPEMDACQHNRKVLKFFGTCRNFFYFLIQEKKYDGITLVLP